MLAWELQSYVRGCDVFDGESVLALRRREKRATRMLNSNRRRSGTAINRSVKKSPVGVMIAHNTSTTMMDSARCFVIVSISTIPSLIRKNNSSGHWKRKPDPRRHQNMKLRYLLTLMSGCK
jgi:hypothetical protein